jgi:hypothetical protein
MSVDFQRTTWRYIPEDITFFSLKIVQMKSVRLAVFASSFSSELYLNCPYMYPFYLRILSETLFHALRGGPLLILFIFHEREIPPKALDLMLWKCDLILSKFK